MKLEDFVLSDPQVQAGTPCFRGTRVPIQSLFSALEHGRSVDYFLKQFSSVTREQVIGVLKCVGEPFTRHPPGQEAA